MTDSQSPPASRRAQFLEIARRRFVADGHARTPVSAIVREAGVAQGTFYLYFKGKQALLAELRREVFRDYASTLVSEGARDCPADERLARVVTAMVDAVARNLDLERVFRHAESAEDTLRVAREGRHRLATTAISFLEEGAEQGIFAVHDHARTATFIVTFFDHILYEAWVYEPESIHAVLEASLRFVLLGVGVPTARVDALVAESRRWRPSP